MKVSIREKHSPLEDVRRKVPILLPSVLLSSNLKYESHEILGAENGEGIGHAFPTTYGRNRISLRSSIDTAEIHLPFRVGVVLSGGPASGGHNVISGIFDYIKKKSSESVLIGFLNGPKGVYSNDYSILDDKVIDCYRNCGGFDLLGTGRHKIEKPEEFEAAMFNCDLLKLDGLVIIGGDDSNSNAAVLAEYFEVNSCKTKVLGAPKTIDGDLKVDPYIPISFGFDTACRTYSELIGNLSQDTLSSKKYYHFVRLMGRAASNIALECALQTRPNLCLISEEVEKKNMTLSQITEEVVNMILARASQGKHYGVILLSEGLIDSFPEFKILIKEIDELFSQGIEATEEVLMSHLSFDSKAVFLFLPGPFKLQLLLDRDPSGNVQVAKIETEKLLAQMVEKNLNNKCCFGEYDGKFIPVLHNFGYEGRAGLPSEFDATYCYAIGQNIGAMVSLGLNGLISSVSNLSAPVSEWECGGLPITTMCHMEKRHGHMVPVIKKSLVNLDGEPFKVFAAQRTDWAMFDLYRSPGPIQFFLSSLCIELSITLTLELTRNDTRMNLSDLDALRAQSPICTPFSLGYTVYSSSKPALCSAFSQEVGGGVCKVKQGTQCRKISDESIIKSKFQLTYGMKMVSIEAQESNIAIKPLKLGVAFCGRQAPGDNDLITGIFNSLPLGSILMGFVGGIYGLVSNHSIEITSMTLAPCLGGKGFFLLERKALTVTSNSYRSVLKTCVDNFLDGLVLIGGPRTLTFAAYLAENIKTYDCITKIVTIPTGITGSMISEGFIETTVGFNTSTKVTGQIVGNSAHDGLSAKKYYYFMRVMSPASHSILEIAFLTKPNFVLLSEEVKEEKMTIVHIVRAIADVVEDRATVGKNYGIVLIPNGLAYVIPELKMLNTEIGHIFTKCSNIQLNSTELRSKLTILGRAFLDSLPEFIQETLLLSREPETHIRDCKVETEKILAHFVEIELQDRKRKGTYKGSFSSVCSFLGYQGRGAAPSNFDRKYAYNLGFAATKLISGGYSGYTASINNLKEDVENWRPIGVPITALMSQDYDYFPICKSDELAGTDFPAESPKVGTSTVNLQGQAYAALVEMRKSCAVFDHYENPGPLQFIGPSHLVNSLAITLELESLEYSFEAKKFHNALHTIKETCRPGCSLSSMHIANEALSSAVGIIGVLENQDRAGIGAAV